MLTTDKAPALIAGVTATESGAMKITILKNTVCAGVMARAGDVMDAPDKDANYLIGLGFAAPHIEEAGPEIPPVAIESHTSKKRNLKHAIA